MAVSTDTSGEGSMMVVYLQAYFVTIATLLGTGILGLPVTLTRCGLYPFLISFLINAVMQSITIHFFVDLLQRACALQLQSQREEEMPLTTIAEEEEEETGLNSDTNGDVVMKELVMPAEERHQRTQKPLSPNLHLLGRLFLHCGCQQLFDALIVLQFIALLICYALAGSEAYAQLLGIKHIYVIPVFVWVLTFAIIFALQLLQPVISILTFLKGTVLCATTMVTFYVGVTLGRSSDNDFTYIASPFLMGTVAIGGSINTMPFTFERIGYKKIQIVRYRTAVHLGLWTCVVLNILWCWSVLDIVPQTVKDACNANADQYLSAAKAAGNSTALCYGGLSLESAKYNGEISTLPMTEILSRDYSTYTWVSTLVQVFIMVSITVSYLTIGGALHHTLNGVAQTILLSRSKIHDLAANPETCCNRLTIISTLVSFLAFLVVFAVAISNPQGFISILEKFVSLTMNGQVGVFVFLMVLASRKMDSADIPAPMCCWLNHFLWTIPVFFNAAVFMDIYDIVRDAVDPVQLVPVLLNVTPSSSLHTTTPFSQLFNASRFNASHFNVPATVSPGG